MCYPKPGPRCSSHAKKALDLAKERYMDDPDGINRHLVFTAQEAYSMTPAGIEWLETRGNKDKADEYRVRRETSLAAFKDLQKNPVIWDSLTDNEEHAYSVIVNPLEDWLDEEEIPNHAPDAEENEWVSLRSMDSEMRAGNNCDAVSTFCLETVISNIGVDPDQEVGLAEMTFSDGTCHVGMYLENADGEQVIIDYTARQFSDDFPFPYVAEREKWEDAVSRYSQARWGIVYQPESG